MGRQAEKPACAFWLRLIDAWGRRGLPVTQNGVAKKLGMDGNGSTGRWYSGDTYPEIETLKRIAELGDVTVDWLLTERLPKHPIDEGTLLGEIHANWSDLDPAGQTHVIESMRGQIARAQNAVQKPPTRHQAGR